MKSQYVACDLGAESGRVILGVLDSGRLELEEIHRFPNGPLRLFGSMRWNILGIFAELKKGLSLLGSRGVAPRALSVDSWGVDYAYFRKDAPLLSPPFHYRDARTETAFPQALARVKKEEIFDQTGIQFMRFNTIYQLFDDLTTQPEVARVAERFLCIADYLNYLFSGRDAAERSLASTTQLYDPQARAWSKKLIKALGLREAVFPEIVDSGSLLGPLLPDVAVETGLPLDTAVAACPSHDTASAVAAVPGEGENWAYLSSGTWSLLGIELPSPIINRESLEKNFTNEIGHGGSVRFLKNIVGLWIMQECRRFWTSSGRQLSYDDIEKAAGSAEAFRSLIHPNDSRFLKPGDMPSRIQEYCRETGQPVPESVGEFSRCIMESLALLYAQTLADASALAKRRIDRLHIVGGGCKNRTLNQFTADACGIEILAGPAEATASGNLLVQAIACGDVSDVGEVRRIVRDSFPLERFSPANRSGWEQARARFEKLPCS